MLKIKLFAVFAFLAFAVFAFLFSSNKSQAQTGKTSERRDEVLEKVAGYKSWLPVQKPEKKSDEPSVVLDSTAMG
jgi:hypothetical protein